MSKKFACSICGEQYIKWQGKCNSCGTWNCIQENIVTTSTQSYSGNSLNLEMLSEIKCDETIFIKSLPEFDQVCGGGIVPKSTILIAGEPGIGKSTLLLQVCGALQSNRISIYITGEEAIEQVKIRADRLKINMTKVRCASASCVEAIIHALEEYDPGLVVIDSIQTLYSSSIDGIPGTVSQMRAASNLLLEWVKKSNATLIIVGHVTKDGTIAGPKVVEHMVDTVLYFEGERGGQPIRLLRNMKNRFGATDVLGVFEITEKGLISIENISKAFINQRSENMIGSVILASIDGSRSILVEMQTLISTSYSQSPRRSVVGWDLLRLNMIAAILETKCKMILGNKDIYFNIVGGIKISEPAADLAAAMAIMSAYHKIALPKIIAFGELSLSGEIRGASKPMTRINEATKLGFKNIHTPVIENLKNYDLIQFKKISDVALWIEKIGKS